MCPRPALIAVLDDEEGYRRAMARLLMAHGYQVATFATGEHLVAEADQGRFGCVLLDLNMAGMSGFDVLAALQNHGAPPPVIVVSAHDDPGWVRRALDLGVFEVQLKPVRTAALLGAIERTLAL